MDFSFTSSGIKCRELYGMLFPMGPFQFFISELLTIDSIELDSFSKETSAVLYNHIIVKGDSLNQKIKELLSYVNLFGMGFFELNVVLKHKIIIVQKKPLISRIHYDVYKKKSQLLIERILIEIIRKVIENIVCRTVSLTIKDDFKNNGVYYNFKILDSSIISRISNHKKKVESQLISQNPIISKIKHEKQLVVEKGVLSLWKTSGVFVPYDMLIRIMMLIREKNETKINQIAQMQLYSAVQFQKKVFGVNDNEQIFNSLLFQTQLIGMGSVKVLQRDSKTITTLLDNSIFSHLLNEEKEVLVEFYSYIVKGIIEFGLDVNSTIKRVEENTFLYTIKSKNRVLSSCEEEISKYLSANILVNKFI